MYLSSPSPMSGTGANMASKPAWRGNIIFRHQDNREMDILELNPTLIFVAAVPPLWRPLNWMTLLSIWKVIQDFQIVYQGWKILDALSYWPLTTDANPKFIVSSFAGGVGSVIIPGSLWISSALQIVNPPTSEKMMTTKLFHHSVTIKRGNGFPYINYIKDIKMWRNF